MPQVERHGRQRPLWRGRASAHVKQRREETIELRDRAAAAERRATLADEARLEHVAEAQEHRQSESRLRAEAEATAADRDGMAAQLETERARSLELHAKLTACVEETERLRRGREDERQTVIAYEGACAENRRLQAELGELRAELHTATAAAAATQEVQQEQQQADDAERMRAAALEERVASLEADKARLEHSLAHAEKVRELFQTVSSRTNEVQQAADAVVRQVEASKRQRAVAASAMSHVATASGGGGGSRDALPRDPAADTCPPPVAPAPQPKKAATAVASGTRPASRPAMGISASIEAAGLAKKTGPHVAAEHAYTRLPMPPSGGAPATGGRRGGQASATARQR